MTTRVPKALSGQACRQLARDRRGTAEACGSPLTPTSASIRLDGLGWLFAGRLLRPLRVIVATAREISATNLSRRLRAGRGDDEFSRLG